jgi:hypothetical protein
VLGNKSAYSTVVSAVTVKDSSIPGIPANLAAVAGFRGVAVSWNATADQDLTSYELQWSSDGGVTYSTPISTKATVVWVPGLTPGTLYYFRVQSVDTSGNPSGYSTAVTATPTSIGSADIGANQVTAAHIDTAGLAADQITSGTLTLQPSAAGSGANTFLVNNSSGVLIGSWDPSVGLKSIDPTNSQNYALLQQGSLTFYQNGVAQATLSPTGIDAAAITFGLANGGHNELKNSSFEAAAFGTATTSVVFTDTAGTPGWKAANRITALDNITEGTALTMTAT